MYSCPKLNWNQGWNWARSESYVWSHEYDSHCFAPSTSQGHTPSTPSTWGLDAKDVIAARGCGQYSCRCPAHDDAQASLRIRVLEDGKILMRCWAGCDTESVLKALDLGWRDVC